MVELMVIVALLAFFGLVMAKTIGTSSWLAHYRLKSAARDLATNLERARGNAIKENQLYRVVFDTGANTYQFQTAGPDKDFTTTGDNTPVDGSLVTLSKYKNGIKFGRGGISTAPPMGAISSDVTFPSNYVTFNFSGSPVKDEQGFCYLTNDQGDVYAVGVLPSGVVRVHRWTGKAWN